MPLKNLRRQDKLDECWWLTPVILAPWEAEIGGLRFKASSVKKNKTKLVKISSKPTAGCGGTALSSQVP
jgi:hypothetical protein